MPYWHPCNRWRLAREIQAASYARYFISSRKDLYLINIFLPLFQGHEGVGTIAQLGEDAPSNLSVGDRVGIPWLGSSCHWCEFCLSGYETLCEQQECTGFTIDGCMSEFALANAEHVVKIPPQLTLEQAARKRNFKAAFHAVWCPDAMLIDGSALLCAGVTTFKGIKETDVR